MNKVNCAVYIRKSTEKGLEQEFNSLHNQEDACKSYILSQAYNHWEFFKTYEDGGISGGTMKRAGLAEMIKDVEKGLIQTVVVYKVDRLSRSIIDFHNMMKEFEKYGCSFVSITQAFDTSNSMGKLTLNMLLSFAQFERELSSERVRDKIASSKVKGLWTGGIHPLGYNIEDKKLVVNRVEAKTVKIILEKYVELRSIAKLREYLKTNSIRAKSWVTNKGVRKGGGIMSISMIARMLRNKVYIGNIENRQAGEAYNGVHEAIIDKELFNEVQLTLGNDKHRPGMSNNRNSFMLNNKIMDGNGNIFKNQQGSRGKVIRYRYYALKGMYLPTGDVEAIVVDIVKDLLNYELNLLLPKSKVMELKSINFEALEIDRQHEIVNKMVSKVIYRHDKLVCHINMGNLSYLKDYTNDRYHNEKYDSLIKDIYLSEDTKSLIVEKDIFINDRVSSNRYEANGKSVLTKSENCLSLIKALACGWRYKKLHEQGLSIANIRKQEQKTERTIYKYLNLTYLSPSIINDIMDSKVPGHVGLQELFSMSSKYVDFQSQSKCFYVNKHM